MFGITLGGKLPQTCTVIDAKNERGRLEIKIIPPETNAVFAGYSVTVVPDTWLVISIQANGETSDYGNGKTEDEIKKDATLVGIGIVNALKNRYGNPKKESKSRGFSWLTWTDNTNEISLTLSDNGWAIIDCTSYALHKQISDQWDNRLRSKVDTNGF